MKGNKAGEGSGTHVLWGVGDVYPGEEEAQGRPHHSLQLLTGGCSQVGVGLFCQQTVTGQEHTVLKPHQGMFTLDSRKYSKRVTGH